MACYSDKSSLIATKVIYFFLYYLRIILSMSKKSKKSLYAFLLKTALTKTNTSQSNKYPRATLRSFLCFALRIPRAHELLRHKRAHQSNTRFPMRLSSALKRMLIYS